MVAGSGRNAHLARRVARTIDDGGDFDTPEWPSQFRALMAGGASPAEAARRSGLVNRDLSAVLGGARAGAVGTSIDVAIRCHKSRTRVLSELGHALVMLAASLAATALVAVTMRNVLGTACLGVGSWAQWPSGPVWSYLGFIAHPVTIVVGALVLVALWMRADRVVEWLSPGYARALRADFVAGATLAHLASGRDPDTAIRAALDSLPPSDRSFVSSMIARLDDGTPLATALIATGALHTGAPPGATARVAELESLLRARIQIVDTERVVFEDRMRRRALAAYALVGGGIAGTVAIAVAIHLNQLGLCLASF